MSNYKKRDFSGAIFLIFIGIIFLLNTTGAVDWGIWLYIFRFWPVFLVLGGLKLIFGHTLLGELLVTTIAILIYTFIGFASYSAYTGSQYEILPKAFNRCLVDDCTKFWGRPGDVEEKSEIISMEKEDIYQSRTITFNIGAADFEVSDSINDNHIIGDFTYNRGDINPYFEKNIEDGKLQITFDTKQEPHYTFSPKTNIKYLFDIGAIESMPTDIYLEIGAAKGDVQLDQTLIKDFNANIGAGSLKVELMEKAIPSGVLNIDIGAGKATLVLPKEVGYTISYDLGIGNLSINGKDIATFVGSEDEKKSENYEESEIKVKIVANVGVGSLQIETK
jgi:predicted membrane protein